MKHGPANESRAHRVPEYESSSPQQRQQPRYFVSAAIANTMTTNQIQSSPVFCHHPNSMFSATIPTDLQNEILARGIPELTPSIGIEAVETAGFATNVNMHLFQDPVNGWPQRDIDFSDGETRRNRWLHTDLMNLSHFHTHLFFKSLVDEGNLK